MRPASRRPGATSARPGHWPGWVRASRDQALSPSSSVPGSADRPGRRGCRRKQRVEIAGIGQHRSVADVDQRQILIAPGGRESRRCCWGRFGIAKRDWRHRRRDGRIPASAGRVRRRRARPGPTSGCRSRPTVPRARPTGSPTISLSSANGSSRSLDEGSAESGHADGDLGLGNSGVLGRDQRSELARLPEHQVRPPVGHDRDQGGQRRLGVESAEDLDHHHAVAFCGRQRRAAGRTPGPSGRAALRGTEDDQARQRGRIRRTSSGAATATSQPAARHAWATGTIGPKCPAPAVVENSTLTSPSSRPSTGSGHVLRSRPSTGSGLRRIRVLSSSKDRSCALDRLRERVAGAGGPGRGRCGRRR